MTYLIWSIEHKAWWAPAQRLGYTTDRDAAGRYTLAEAEDICRMDNRWKRPGTTPEDVIVPNVWEQEDSHD